MSPNRRSPGWAEAYRMPCRTMVRDASSAHGGKRTSDVANGRPKSALHAPSAESVPPASNGERMVHQPGIAGRQAHALFQRLDKQQFVERIFVPERLCA